MLLELAVPRKGGPKRIRLSALGLDGTDACVGES